MTEKTTTVNDENGNPKDVTVPAAIDSQQFNDSVSYRNTNTYQPEAPASVSLTFTGNEVMTRGMERRSTAPTATP